MDKNTYYFGSEGGRIYKSIDAGATWASLANAGSSLINKILIHPSSPDTIFVSGQGSGHYRSNDGGQSWIKITNDPSSYDIMFKPGDLNTVFATGTGVHKSIDGGLAFSSFQPRFPFQILGGSDLDGEYLVASNGFSEGNVPIPTFPDGIQADLALYMDNENYLACNGEAENGDELSGKIVVVRRGDCNFTQKVVNAQNYGAAAVLVVNNEEGTMTMGGGDASIFIPAVIISQSTGETFITALEAGDTLQARLELPIYNSFTTGPKMLGMSADNPEVVYIIEAAGGAFGAFYRSMDGGENFEKIDQGDRNYFGYSTEGLDNSGQAPRDMAIAVNPGNFEEVHIAGVLTWRSFDGGNNFECTADWIPSNAFGKNIGYCHADVDIMEFIGDTLYVGTDGGLFVAENTLDLTPEYFTDLTSGLGIRQFYKIGISQTDPVVISGGSQDNGTSFYTEERGWIDWLGADGMETFVDKENTDIMFGTSQFGSFYVTTDAAGSIFNLDQPGSGRGNWVTPFEQDPISPLTVYMGYEEVYKSSDFGFDWFPISQSFPNKLDHLKIAQSDPNIMFCTHGNNLYRTTDGGLTDWEQLSGFDGRITSIAIHPSNPLKVAISTNASEKVFVSTDGGTTWEGYRKNLPNFNALALVWQNDEYDGLYVGMNYGIFYIDNLEDSWLPFNNNLPNVIINELEINYANNKIYAGTYGRTFWVSNIMGTSKVKNVVAKKFEVKVYPNPSSGEIIVNWEEARNLLTDFKLFDANGKLIKYVKDENPLMRNINLGEIPQGVYYLRMSNSLGIATEKLVIR